MGRRVWWAGEEVTKRAAWKDGSEVWGGLCEICLSKTKIS